MHSGFRGDVDDGGYPAFEKFVSERGQLIELSGCITIFHRQVAAFDETMLAQSPAKRRQEQRVGLGGAAAEATRSPASHFVRGLPSAKPRPPPREEP